MTNTLPTEDESDKKTPSSMAAFSDKLEELKEALDLLYIPYNASGRNKFREKHPLVAQYIFGSELIEYDNNGVKNHEHRIKLEEKANERRIDLKITISEVIEKSVDSGTLMFDYVGQVIDKYGADVSRFLYNDDIIERVRPGLLNTKNEENNKNDKVDSDESPLSKEEKEILSNSPPPVSDNNNPTDSSDNGDNSNKDNNKEDNSGSKKDNDLTNSQANSDLENGENNNLSNIDANVEDADINNDTNTDTENNKKIIYKDIFNLAAIGKNNG